MNDFFIEKKDFSEMYKKLLHQYLLGNLPLLGSRERTLLISIGR